ncbi:MAG TPA: nucleotidyltransferase domain-containing protein [bacterium]|nr:nucleotidyltransferase domain-containing protein [bacterium]
MFTVEERDRVRHAILKMAHADPRVVAGAMIGSLALGAGDSWSDLDLGFGLVDGSSPSDVLAQWTSRLEREFGAVHLFDLPSLSTIYRVFLFPGCLEVDVSMTPASEFGAHGPKFKVLFGRAVERPQTVRPPAEHLFGLGVHHAVRARFCVARGRFWQAQYWIGEVRNLALSLACRRRGLEVRQGRGYDELPAEILATFEETLVRSMNPGELLRALGHVVGGLLREATEAAELASKVEGHLSQLASPRFVGRLSD